MRIDVPDIIECDQCGEQTTFPVGHWVTIQTCGAINHANPFSLGKEFCSFQCAAMFLINAAEGTEIFGHPMMKALNR